MKKEKKSSSTPKIYYKSKTTTQLTPNIKSAFNKTSRLAQLLITGKFAKSFKAGTSLEALDIFRACRIRYQDLNDIFLKNTLISLLYNSLQSHHSLTSFLSAYFIDCDINITSHDIMMASRCATSTDVDEFYSVIVRDERTQQLFKKIRTTAGSGANITIQNTLAKKDDVILNQHNIYPLSIPCEFWRYASKASMDLIDVGVISVDGTIMNVGEINGCLMHAYENKQPFILLCRDLSQEVLATLLKNYELGKLNVFPVIIPSGEMGNILYDISYLANAHVVSTITGDILKSQNKERWGTIDRLTIEKNVLEINIKNKERAKNLLNKITKERQNFVNEFGGHGEFVQIFDKRKKAASTEICKVYITKFGIGQQGIITDRLKSLTRIHNEIKENGVVDLNKFKGQKFRDLENLGLTMLPTTSLIYSLQATRDIRNKLLTSSKILILC